MRFPLDLVFLDGEDRVVRLVPGVGSWRVAWGGWRARSVVELAAGWLPDGAVPVGAPAVIAATPGS